MYLTNRELDQTSSAVSQTPPPGAPPVVVEDGDTYTFVPPSVGTGFTPVYLQLTALGVNGMGEELQQVWNIQFSNNCAIFPVVPDGFQIGWAKVVSGAPLIAENPAESFWLTTASFA